MYKDERAQSFEAFLALLRRSLDSLSKCEREKHHGYIVDVLWPCIKAPVLKSHSDAVNIIVEL